MTVATTVTYVCSRIRSCGYSRDEYIEGEPPDRIDGDGCPECGSGVLVLKAPRSKRPLKMPGRVRIPEYPTKEEYDDDGKID